MGNLVSLDLEIGFGIKKNDKIFLTKKFENLSLIKLKS